MPGRRGYLFDRPIQLKFDRGGWAFVRSSRPVGGVGHRPQRAGPQIAAHRFRRIGRHFARVENLRRVEKNQDGNLVRVSDLAYAQKGYGGERAG